MNLIDEVDKVLNGDQPRDDQHRQAMLTALVL